MKVSREQAEQNRESLLDAASRLYREHGFDGVGVGQVAKEAGLTHGGLYAHFDSKDDFIGEACSHAFVKGLGSLEAVPPGDLQAFARFVKQYLSDRHRDDVATGCPMAALAADAARRQGGHTAEAMTAGIDQYVSHFAALLQAGHDPDTNAAKKADHRADAMTLLSTMVGALVLARATRSEPATSRKFLAAARTQFDGVIRQD
ncbi:MAG: Transcriptional regulator, AcrR family [uncultured Paraburkholderia sp.]|nr:MAG: Transcriptional regulator, AcrR family [uncultured Paraburkholderia sp.]CAH2923569.1 MAG: Transcriptional regulator, AcrR family [uncultured Paraburkholderia sp.]